MASPKSSSGSWPAPPPASEPVGVARWKDGRVSAERDRVAVEVPVALSYNGVSHAVMLATPADLDDFALGFSLTEGILDSPHQLQDVETEIREDGIVLEMRIAAEPFLRLKDRRRSMAGRTGCGLCGADSLEQVSRALPPVTPEIRFDPALLHAAAAAMLAGQPLQRETGATHAAAWIDAGGAIAAIREDVGRHNALDKLIGALARRRTDMARGAFIVTSRASFEMVQKSVAAGAGLLAAVSAPSTMAIAKAEAWNLTLVGFLRPGSHVTYSHPWRLEKSEE